MHAIRIQRRAMAGIEMRRVLQHDDGGFDRVERASAADAARPSPPAATAPGLLRASAHSASSKSVRAPDAAAAVDRQRAIHARSPLMRSARRFQTTARARLVPGLRCKCQIAQPHRPRMWAARQHPVDQRQRFAPAAVAHLLERRPGLDEIERREHVAVAPELARRQRDAAHESLVGRDGRGLPPVRGIELELQRVAAAQDAAARSNRTVWPVEMARRQMQFEAGQGFETASSKGQVTQTAEDHCEVPRMEGKFRIEAVLDLPKRAVAVRMGCGQDLHPAQRGDMVERRRLKAAQPSNIMLPGRAAEQIAHRADARHRIVPEPPDPALEFFPVTRVKLASLLDACENASRFAARRGGHRDKADSLAGVAK